MQSRSDARVTKRDESRRPILERARTNSAGGATRRGAAGRAGAPLKHKFRTRSTARTVQNPAANQRGLTLHARFAADHWRQDPTRSRSPSPGQTPGRAARDRARPRPNATRSRAGDARTRARGVAGRDRERAAAVCVRPCGRAATVCVRRAGGRGSAAVPTSRAARSHRQPRPGTGARGTARLQQRPHAHAPSQPP